MKNQTTVERKSDRELVVTRTVNAPVHLVYEAWTKAELFKQWWPPKSHSFKLVSCELDVRVGGSYRLEFAVSADKTIAFFGKYIEVVPGVRFAWTNDEGGEGGPITTVTFEEKDGKTLQILHDLYPSKEALDAGAGDKDGIGETFEQLDELLAK